MINNSKIRMFVICGLAFSMAACSTLPSTSSTRIQLDDEIIQEMVRACAPPGRTDILLPEITTTSSPDDTITRTEQAIWFESERAIAVLANGDEDDVQDLLSALDNVHAVISSDWACYRQSVGNANFHLLNTGPLGHLRDVALTAYAEAIVTHNNKHLAAQARESWTRFNLTISLPPDGKIFHRLAPGIIEEDDIQSVFDEPGYTEASRFLDGLDNIHTSGINEQFPDVQLEEYDNLIGDDRYLKGIILNNLLCSEDGQAFLKARYGLRCRIESYEGSRWYEVFNPTPIEDSRDHYELYDVEPTLTQAKAAYIRERNKWLMEFQASPPKCVGAPLGMCPGNL